jgi:pimeloyl-ACP methyl ester carboxylesterase
MFVRIGGIDQWVQFRGEDRNNPVLLILHGGPAASNIPFTFAFRAWEKYFTVVQWDQRGTGKTFGRNEGKGDGGLTIDRIAQDGIELAEFICKRLHKKQLILLGYSWGTVVGLPMVKRRPDLFYAYVGTGQIIDMLRNEKVTYKMVLDRVRASGDQSAIRKLEDIGPPPYKDMRSWWVKQKLIAETAPAVPDGIFLEENFYTAALFAPNYSLKDSYDFFASIYYSGTAMIAELMSYDARRLGGKFETPMFFFQGESDVNTPTQLVEEYFPTIQAPEKELVVLKDCGHVAVWSRSDVFLDELVARVRPLAVDH